MRANAQNVQQGEQGTRGVGEGRKKKVGNRAMRRSVERRGMGWDTQGKQDGHYRNFQEGSREFDGGGFGVD